MITPDHIILALDTIVSSEIKHILDSLDGRLTRVKVGSVLFSSRGPAILEEMQRRNLKIFLDLKYHDIPNTVAEAVRGICADYPIDLLTVHASGGEGMIRKAREAMDSVVLKARTRIVAVTVLTSQTQHDLSAVNIMQPLEEQVSSLARLAQRGGAHGIVCSPLELRTLKPMLPADFIYVVPGIRTDQEKGIDDQKRTASAADAVAWGATHLVIGRPLLKAADPALAFDRILKSAS